MNSGVRNVLVYSAMSKILMQKLFAPLLTVWLVLAGCAAVSSTSAVDAAQAPAAQRYYYPPASPPDTPSAWDFINAEPDLTRSAALLSDLGLDGSLRGSFKGTLLLPTNAAWEKYVADMNYIPTPDPLGGRSDAPFYKSLINYHTLPRAVSLKVRSQEIRVNTNHIRESSTSSVQRHQLRISASGSVFPEQTIYGFGAPVSIDNAVFGGGFVHIVDLVLQPDDLFMSMNAMYTRPGLENIRELMKLLNLTTMWSNSCIWIGDDEYNAQAYEDMPQASSHRCVPCWESSVGCGTYMYEPPGGTNGMRRSSVRVSAFDDLVDIEKRTQRALETGTHGIERFAGTFILPSNKAFINGLPTEADPEKWEPIVQNHFVSAGSVPVLSNSNALMKFDSKLRDGFPSPNKRRSFLGQMRNDASYTHTYTATKSGCGIDRQSPCLTIQYPTLVNGRVRLDKANIQARAINLQTPGHFYHIIDKTMVPPCVTRRECIKAFAPGR